MSTSIENSLRTRRFTNCSRLGAEAVDKKLTNKSGIGASSCATMQGKVCPDNIRFFLVNSSVERMPAEGIEPTRSCDHWILSPARLPVPPRRREEIKLQNRNLSSSASRCARRSDERALTSFRTCLAPTARCQNSLGHRPRTLIAF